MTSRLIVTPLAEQDIPDFVAYRCDEQIARWQSWSTDYSTDDALALVRGQAGWGIPPAGQWIQLAVRDRGGVLLGDLALQTLADQPDTYELGATFAAAHQRKGYATEAARCLLDYLFESNSAHRVVGFCDVRNEASARLLHRIGMRRESRQLEADWFKGEWTSVDGYAVLAREYRVQRHS